MRLQSLNLAADRLVFLDDCLVPACPVRQNREHEHSGFKGEGERSLIYESDGNSAIFVVRKNFNVLHDLVVGFGKICKLSYTILSHAAPRCVVWLGLRHCVISGVARCVYSSRARGNVSLKSTVVCLKSAGITGELRQSRTE